MIKLVNTCGIEFKAWIVQNDVQLFKELEQEGFELEIKQTDNPKWLGNVMINQFPVPLIEGYILAKSLDDDIIDYFINPDLIGSSTEETGKAYIRL